MTNLTINQTIVLSHLVRSDATLSQIKRESKVTHPIHCLRRLMALGAVENVDGTYQVVGAKMGTTLMSLGANVLRHGLAA